MLVYYVGVQINSEKGIKANIIYKLNAFKKNVIKFNKKTVNIF